MSKPVEKPAGESAENSPGKQNGVKWGNQRIPLPASRLARSAIGVALVAGGILGFLPVLGFWMVPLGVLVLSYDFPWARRMRRRVGVWWQRRVNGGARAKRQDSE